MAFAFYPTAWALAIEHELTATERAVLLALADHANQDGQCFPSQQRLAKFTGAGERSVRRALKRLEEVDLITRSPRFDSRGHRSSDLIELLYPPDRVAARDRQDSQAHHRPYSPSQPATVAGEPTIEPLASKEKKNGKKYRRVKGPCVSDGRNGSDIERARELRGLAFAQQLVDQGEAEWALNDTVRGGRVASGEPGAQAPPDESL
jgi:hypothetical protein